MTTSPSSQTNGRGSSGDRLRGFRIHLLIFALTSALAIFVNLALDGGLTWALFIIVAWGAPLAVHCAYVMKLFGSGQ